MNYYQYFIVQHLKQMAFVEMKNCLPMTEWMTIAIESFQTYAEYLHTWLATKIVLHCPVACLRGIKRRPWIHV